MKKPTCECIENKIKELNLTHIRWWPSDEEYEAATMIYEGINYPTGRKIELEMSIWINVLFCPQCGAPYTEDKE